MGNRPIIIQECGRIRGNIIDTTDNKYLTIAFEPQIIPVGEAVILKYQKNVGISFEDKDITSGKIKNIFGGNPVGVRDSRNNIHYTSQK